MSEDALRLYAELGARPVINALGTVLEGDEEVLARQLRAVLG